MHVLRVRKTPGRVCDRVFDLDLGADDLLFPESRVTSS
jgi:hypothetical protein